MEFLNNTPCAKNALVCVAGCTDDGLVYAASIDPVIFDMNLWVHSGVQEKWRLLATLKLAPPPDIANRYCLMSAAIAHDKNSVDVFVEAAESTGYLFRFFVFKPEQNCVFKCIDAAKIQFDGSVGPVLHWLGDDCLLVAGKPRDEDRFHIWRIDVARDSMAFTLTDLIVYDLGEVDQAVSICADEEFLYVFGVPPGQIKMYTKSHDGRVKLCKEVKFPISHFVHEMKYICAYPSTGGQRLLLPRGGHWYIFDCQSQSLQQITTFDDNRRIADYFVCFTEKLCTASSAQFFALKVNGKIAQRRIGMPSLQYLCLQKLCKTWPALKTCTNKKKAKKLGIPRTIWSRFFKPLKAPLKVEECHLG